MSVTLVIAGCSDSHLVFTQKEAKYGDCEVICTQEWAVTDWCQEIGEQYYDLEEHSFIQIIRNVIYDATDINPGNNQL
jgi:hypothetical protein